MPRNFLQSMGLMKEDATIVPEIKEEKNPSKGAVVEVMNFNDKTAPSANVVTSKNDYKAYLLKVIEENKLTGLNFNEFYKALSSYADKAWAEKEKYEIAFTAFNAAGITKEQLVGTAHHYLEVLSKEEASFEEQLQNEGMVVTKASNRVSGLINENEELNKKLLANTQEIEKLGIEIKDKENSLATEKNNFEFFLNEKKNDIEDKIAKIKLYLN